MADWWLDNDQIASMYRCAADRAEQVRILGQLCSATKKEVLEKLMEIGSIDGAKYEELLNCGKRNGKLAPQRVMDAWKSLYDSGYSDSAIAKISNVRRGTIASWRHRLGLKPNNPALGTDGYWHDQTWGNTKSEVER